MKQKVKKKVGIWVDHRKAVVVSIKSSKQILSIIESGMEKNIRVQGGSRSSVPYGPKDEVSENRAENRYKHHLHQYYQKVLLLLQDSHNIFIFGPGEAKIELEKEIKGSRVLKLKVVGIEPADRMTINQIVSKVRSYYDVKTK